MADVVTRAGQEADLARCADLWMIAKAHREGTEPATVNRDKAMTAMQVPPVIFQVVVAEDRPDDIVGFAFVSDRTAETDGVTRKAFLEYVVVGTAAQGRGIGSSLVTGVTDELRRMGYEVAELHVLIDNARARAVYERHGWRWTGEEFDEPGQELPDLVYAIDLVPTEVVGAAAH